MKTFFDTTDREELLQRLQKLNPQSKPVWGKMNTAQMLAHCTVGMQAPLGEIVVKKTFASLIGWMFKKSLLGDKPFPKNSPTAAEFLVANERDYEAETKRFLDTFHKLARGSAVIVCHQHAFFGKVTDEEWGRLMYKHIDHHLQQFGA